jgi:hypothetical protein
MGDSVESKHLYHLLNVENVVVFTGCVLGLVSPPDPCMALHAKYTLDNLEIPWNLSVQCVSSSFG